MTQRFGRNKRREARRLVDVALQRMEAARNDAARANSERQSAEYRAAHAVETALESLMRQQPSIERAMDLIASRLGEQLGNQLRPIAEQVLAAGNRRGPALSFSARMESRAVSREPRPILRGEIHLDYNVVLDR